MLSRICLDDGSDAVYFIRCRITGNLDAKIEMKERFGVIMKEIIIGGYGFVFQKIETNFKYAEEVKQGIADAIKYSKASILKNIDLNELTYKLFSKFVKEYSDEEVFLNFKKSIKNDSFITIDMVDIKECVRDYIMSLTKKHIDCLQDKFEAFLKELEIV